MSASRYVMGVDIGTSAVKVAVVAEDGAVAARGTAGLPAPEARGACREQDAALWWSAAREGMRAAVARLGAAAGRIDGVCVDGTSGTIVPVDHLGRPLRPGLMYNDGRAAEQARRLNELGAATLARLGYRFNASFSLPKILWLREEEPQLYARARFVLHQADFVVARLTGTERVSDESNALKSGYDIVAHAWPDYIARAGIEPDRLPRVVATGAMIGEIDREMAGELGLSPRCRIVGGMTDGTAACVGSGARRPGDMNTTLGSTVVWKLLAPELVNDPAGRLYCHRHPSGCYLPGGAGNAGGEGIAHLLAASREVGGGGDLRELARGLRAWPMGTAITYPLPRPGERYPFVAPLFSPFTTLTDPVPDALYQSCLEGIACIERWGYEVASGLGAPAQGDVWTSGHGATIDAWMQMRADALDRPVRRAAEPDSAFGAALVAAMCCWHGGSWPETAARMIRDAFACEPDAGRRAAWAERYARFKEACRQRGAPG